MVDIYTLLLLIKNKFHKNSTTLILNSKEKLSVDASPNYGFYPSRDIFGTIAV